MWPMENHLLCFSYVNAHFIQLSLDTNMSQLFGEGTFSMLKK